MYLKKTKQKNGRIHLDIIDSYYDSEKKATRQITIKSLGYVDELKSLHVDPENYYKKIIDKYNSNMKNNSYSISLNFKTNEKMKTSSIYEKNFGFLLFSKIYHGLEIHKFFNNKQRHRNDSFNANEVFKILLNGHLISRFDRKSWFLKKTNFTTNELIEFFHFIEKNKFDLIKWVNKRLQKYYDRGTCYIYENIASFNFSEKSSAELEINRKNTFTYDQIRHSDFLSMYLDSHGIPYAYRQINKYNCHEDNEVFYEKLSKELGITKFVVVGDRLDKTKDELHNEIISHSKLKYVFAIDPQIADQEIQDFIHAPGSFINFRNSLDYKTMMFPRNITLDNKSNKVILEKQIILRIKPLVEADKMKRAALVDKATYIIKNPSKVTIVDLGNEIKYIKKLSFLPNGNIDIENSILELDTDLIDKSEKYDGIKLIITNDSQNSLSHILDTYYYQYGLESVLKHTKSTMQKKSPLFKDEDYINYTATVHLTTFIGLILVRILFLSLEKKYTIKTILSSIAKYNCVLIHKNYYFFTYYDNVLKDIGEKMDLDLSKRIRTLKEIKHMLAQVKKNE